VSLKIQYVLAVALGAAGCGDGGTGGGGAGGTAAGGTTSDAGPGGAGGSGNGGEIAGGSGGQGSGGTPTGGAVGGAGGGGGTPAGGSGGGPVGGTPQGGSGGQAQGGSGGEPVGGTPQGGSGGGPVGGTPQGGAGGDIPQGGSGGGGAGGAVVPETLDCDEFCLVYHAECAGYFALRSTCDILCPAIGAGIDAAMPVHIETFERADLNCRQGLATQSCGQMYACMNDDDGLNAIGDGATIRYEGILNGEPVDLRSDSAWLMVGTKADGAPGDLEAIFEAGGVVYSIEMNDFLADWDPVAMDETILENNKVDRTTEVERIRLRVQSIDVQSLELDGAVDFTATLSDPDLPAGTSEINLTVTGSLHQ
jgi:hypothetical protein